MVQDDTEESAAVMVGTLYISPEQLKCVQCIVRGGIHIGPTRTVSILAAWH